ncbi:Uma2 family endonuclease [Salicibibacter cibarius]|uniref:Uma2 family endonuclease n=1 Tax=Salicibibacter cibarius TaxID=2743000 RepID=UPI001FE3D2C9|nr:Uma2 family endonuclease [Salicibibacter cibarius]
MNDKKKDDLVRERPMTYEDYANMPDDGNRYELVDGVLELMSPAPSPTHQMISSEIQQRIKDDCEQDYITFVAPIDVIFAEKVVRQPDLVLVHRDRFSEIVKKRGLVGTPDLVVEILSPYSVKRDRESKMRSYVTYKVPEFWIVDPANEALEQYILENDHYPLPNVYTEDDNIQSERLQCVSFCINDILENIPEIPAD